MLPIYQSFNIFQFCLKVINFYSYFYIKFDSIHQSDSMKKDYFSTWQVNKIDEYFVPYLKRFFHEYE